MQTTHQSFLLVTRTDVIIALARGYELKGFQNRNFAQLKWSCRLEENIKLTIIETQTKLWRIFSSSKAFIDKARGMLRCSCDKVPRLVHPRRIGSKIPFNIQSFKALWLLNIPTGLILKVYVLSTECIFVFVWISEQMSRFNYTALNNCDAGCLLCGTSWMLIYGWC